MKRSSDIHEKLKDYVEMKLKRMGFKVVREDEQRLSFDLIAITLQNKRIGIECELGAFVKSENIFRVAPSSIEEKLERQLNWLIDELWFFFPKNVDLSRVNNLLNDNHKNFKIKINFVGIEK